jgi:hypothetical protein
LFVLIAQVSPAKLKSVTAKGEWAASTGKQVGEMNDEAQIERCLSWQFNEGITGGPQCAVNRAVLQRQSMLKDFSSVTPWS